MVEQWSRDSGTVQNLMVENEEQRWWNSATSHGGAAEYLMVKQWNRSATTVDHLIVEQLNNHGGKSTI